MNDDDYRQQSTEDAIGAMRLAALAFVILIIGAITALALFLWSN